MLLRRLIASTVIMATALTPIVLQAATGPDCDTNAVVWCGASTQADLMKIITNGDGHNSAANILAIYAQNSIQTSDIASTADGVVTKSGNVLVANKVVATN